MKRLLGAAVACLLTAPPAAALELGSPYLRVGVDVGYDDHVSMRETPDAASYPLGNTDALGSLSLGAVEEATLAPNLILTLSGRLKGTRYLNYGDFSGFWGSSTVELATYHFLGELDGFWSISGGTSFATGNVLGFSGSLEHPLPLGWVGGVSVGGYGYTGSSTTDHTGLWGELSLRTHLGPAAVTLAGSTTRRAYIGLSDLTYGPSLYTTWQLYQGCFLKASVERMWTTSSDATRAYTGNTMNLGSVYYSF